MHRILLLLPFTLAAAPAATAAQDLDDLIERVEAGVMERAKLAQVMVDKIFSFSELGQQEIETSAYVTGILEENGFTVERGVSGIPTAWMARWGSGRPVISFGSDIDGIPKANQKPGVAYHDPLIAGAPGHGEGHNSGQGVNVVAALALKDVMEAEGIEGTLVLWPGVAEEQLGSKAWYVRDGLMDDIDVTLFTHVSSNLSVSWGQGNGTGLVSVEFTFEGEAAHGAGSPWRGRSALDAVELMNVAWNFRREHLHPNQRSHYVISDGGDQPNVVPQRASVWYFIREMDYEDIKRNFETAIRIAEGAAMMTDTEMTYQVRGAAWPRHFNRTVAETMYEHIEDVGLPEWTEDDHTFAKAVQQSVGSDPNGMPTELSESWHARPAPQRRFGRHRRHLLDDAHGHPPLPLECAGPARPPLVERDGHGDPNCAQGRRGWRPRPGANRAAALRGTRPRRRGVGVLQRRAVGRHGVRPVHRTGRPAAHRSQQGDHGHVSPPAQAILLRRDEVRDVPGAAGDYLPDAEAGDLGGGHTFHQIYPARPFNTCASAARLSRL